jgi:hypothetical protein
MGGRIMPRNGEFWYGEMNRTNFGKNKMENVGEMPNCPNKFATVHKEKRF